MPLCFLAHYCLASITRRRVFTLLCFKIPVFQISSFVISPFRNSRKLPHSRALPMLHSNNPVISQSHPYTAMRFSLLRAFALPRLRSTTYSPFPPSTIPGVNIPKPLFFQVSTLSRICAFVSPALSAPVSSRLRALVSVFINSATLQSCLTCEPSCLHAFSGLRVLAAARSRPHWPLRHAPSFSYLGAFAHLRYRASALM